MKPLAIAVTLCVPALSLAAHSFEGLQTAQGQTAQGNSVATVVAQADPGGDEQATITKIEGNSITLKPLAPGSRSRTLTIPDAHNYQVGQIVKLKGDEIQKRGAGSTAPRGPEERAPGVIPEPIPRPQR